MSRWISRLMNTLCQPFVRRISSELATKQAQEFAELKLAIQMLRQAAAPAILPLVLKNEIEHLQQLPRTFLHMQEDLMFVGYTSRELQPDFPSAEFMVPPVDSHTVLSGDTLVFLDEYHFANLIRTLPTMLNGIRINLLLPYRGEYFQEGSLRQLLHQLGFTEVFVLDYEKLLDSYSISGISNPLPVSSLPEMISPTTKSDAITRWLIANRIPTQT